ncbi:hypothetical protein ACQY0O_004452 [Thecaphora frezii]
MSETAAVVGAQLPALDLSVFGIANDSILGKQLFNLITRVDGRPWAFTMSRASEVIDLGLIYGGLYASTILSAGFSGILLGLTGIYFVFYGGRRGDRWFLQLGVLVCTLIHLSSAVLLCYMFFGRIFNKLLQPDGLDLGYASIEIPITLGLSTLPFFLGQCYFLARNAMLFERGRKIFVAVGFTMIFIQTSAALVLIIGLYGWSLDFLQVILPTKLHYFGSATLRVSMSLLVVNEIGLSASLWYKLRRLREQSHSSAINSIMYRLNKFNLYWDLIILGTALWILITEALELTGFYVPIIFVQAVLHTIFVMINLIYRRSMTDKLVQATPSRAAQPSRLQRTTDTLSTGPRSDMTICTCGSGHPQNKQGFKVESIAMEQWRKTSFDALA